MKHWTWPEPLEEKTRKRKFLEETERVVVWSVVAQIVEPHYPKAEAV